MANKNIKEVEGGATATINDTDAFEVDTGSSSLYVIWSTIKSLIATYYNGVSAVMTSKTLVQPTIADFTNATHNHGNAAGGGATLSSPTIVTPTIASFVNANHDHSSAAGGGIYYLNDYKIVPSVASNNLSLDIQRYDGTAVSSSAPLKFRVGGTVYILTSSPSFAKNAGTNWANAGAAETAAQDIDWFVYAIGETGASAGLKFGYSRIPYAQTMNDFSSTSTNEKYILGNYTNFNTSDPVVNIGRFRATLGASASYNWSLPNSLVLNYPVFETDFLTYAPTLTGFSANPTNTIYQYQVQGKQVIVRSRQQANGTSNGTGFTMTAPFTSQTLTNASWQAAAMPVVDNGAASATVGLVGVGSASASITVQRDALATAWTNINGKRVGYFELRYPIAA